jgi:hypothetical protein
MRINNGQEQETTKEAQHEVDHQRSYDMDYLYELKQGDQVGGAEGPLYEERDEDGISYRYNTSAIIYLDGPRVPGELYGWVHNYGHRWRYLAEEFALQVKLRGYIDMSCWMPMFEPTEDERYHQLIRDLEDERDGFL